MKKLPVILITGFLGSGKTTFLNELLIHLNESGKSVALLINEFGRTNIDKDLVDSDAGTVFEVNQGSIFCVCTRDQFIKTLDNITTHSPSFDVAIIESTGIANTRDIGEYLSIPPLQGRIDIKQNFCLIDAANFHKVFKTLPAVKSQVEEASVCVVNKTDLVSADYIIQLENSIRELNPDSSLVQTAFGKINFSKWLDLSGTWTTRSSLDITPPQNISSVTLASSGLFDKEKVKRLLVRQEKSLLRAKGFLNTGAGSIYIEWVGAILYTKQSYKKNDPISRLVLIGYKLDEERIKDEFNNCVVSS